MVGKALYTTNSHCTFPKILSEIKGKTLFQYSQSYQNALHEEVKKIYLRPQSIENNFGIDSIIRQVVGNNVEIIDVSDYTAGALCTCLLAADFWDENDELIIISADQYIDIETQNIIDHFRQTNTDLGLLTFSSVHPKWSYIKRDDRGDIIEVVENKVISSEAVASFFYFKKTSLFIEAAKNSIMKSNAINGNFYLSSCINEVILLEAKITSKVINKDDYYSFYDLNAINGFATRL